jgi:hypothetical protein
MNNEFSILNVSRAAWAIFCKEWSSWVILSSGWIFLMLASFAAYLYFPEYTNFLALFLCFAGAIYTALLHQNGLDAVYGRKLSMFKITPALLFASLFFIAISLYSPFPEYLELLLLVLPEDFQFLILINWTIHIFVSYLLVRCMFVGMILLEEKCSVMQAFRKSFKLTARNLLLLLGVFIFLALGLALSALTIVGYFIALPCTVLVKSLLFKQLNEMQQ